MCTGKAYTKKTEGAVCDELKQRKYMKAYVEEAAGTTLCDVASLAGCEDGEKDYIAKWSARTAADIAEVGQRTTAIYSPCFLSTPLPPYCPVTFSKHGHCFPVVP